MKDSDPLEILPEEWRNEKEGKPEALTVQG
jgi:hypothetical protein